MCALFLEGRLPCPGHAEGIKGMAESLFSPSTLSYMLMIIVLYQVVMSDSKVLSGPMTLILTAQALLSFSHAVKLLALVTVSTHCQIPQ